jgi:hypothetical protein
MARKPRTTDEPEGIDVSMLQTAELHELETFEEPTNGLRQAAQLMSEMAAASVKGDDGTPPKAEPEGEPLADAAARKRADSPLEPVQRVPGWAKIPEGGFRFPKHVQVMFVRFRAEWTDTPALGDRVIICWGLSPGDQRFAVKRAMGDNLRVTDELVQQTIRAIDGNVADWGTMGMNSPAVFWNQIGVRCRNLMTKVHIQLNTLGPKETRNFLETCLAVVTTG